MSNNLQALAAFTQSSSGILSQIAKFKYFPQAYHTTTEATRAAICSKCHKLKHSNKFEFEQASKWHRKFTS